MPGSTAPSSASVVDLEIPSEITAALKAWFDDVWGAYEAQHAVTHEWIRRVLAADGGTDTR